MYTIHPKASSLRNSPAPPRPVSPAALDDDIEIIASDREETARPARPVEARGRKRYSEEHEDGAARAQRVNRSFEDEASLNPAPALASSGRESQTKVTQLTRDVLMANTNGTQGRREAGTVPSTSGSGNNKLQHVRHSVPLDCGVIVFGPQLTDSGTYIQLSTEKLQAMLANNKDELIRVLQKLLDEDVDREMIEMQS